MARVTADDHGGEVVRLRVRLASANDGPTWAHEIETSTVFLANKKIDVGRELAFTVARMAPPGYEWTRACGFARDVEEPSDPTVFVYDFTTEDLVELGDGVFPVANPADLIPPIALLTDAQRLRLAHDTASAFVDNMDEPARSVMRGVAEILVGARSWVSILEGVDVELSVDEVSLEGLEPAEVFGVLPPGLAETLRVLATDVVPMLEALHSSGPYYDANQETRITLALEQLGLLVGQPCSTCRGGLVEVGDGVRCPMGCDRGTVYAWGEPGGIVGPED